MENLITGNEAAAWGARLSRVECIPNFPITPQTEIIETLAQWIADGDMDADFWTLESEHSVLSAAIGSEATGARTFTATSSQGLVLMHEVMYIASGMRLPFVMATVSRGLSAPITLWSDHNDFLANLNTGWLMFHAQNNQEILDSIIMAYRIAEDNKVLLPAMVNMDGYVLSYTKEPVEFPAQAKVDKFLGKYRPKHAFFDAKNPLVQGPAVLLPHDYTYFRYQHDTAARNALSVTRKACEAFRKQFGREYGLLESYKCDDAKTILVTQGSISTTAKAAVNAMRKKGKKVGLLRLRLIRPWPAKDVARELANAEHVAVLDKNVAPGQGGIMSPHVKAALFEYGAKPIVTSFIMGLGGNPESVGMFEEAVRLAEKDKRGGVLWLE
ncbi:MAG: hypothetical protein JW834_00610 [Candidatus Diapherotrites archaeon]|nr:hypothetical protein [Candidatus Diapherotrites archaeon]